MSCGVSCRHGLDLALLCLWHRLAAAVPIRPVAWELPYTTGVALKRKKKKTKTPNNNNNNPFKKEFHQAIYEMFRGLIVLTFHQATT